MFTEEELKKVEEIRSHYPTNLAAVMGVLHMYQDKFGFVAEEGISFVAKLIDVPEEHVLGVATFYEMYHQHPTGKHKLQVCTNVSCMLCNSDMVLKTIKDRIGIGIGEMTEDGMFSVHEVECLGSCGTAPVVSVNKQYHENLTPEKINELIDTLKARG
jgi:NADH-quinone oxidoreductase E subunit